MYLENIADYVRKGGALLETSGQGYASPLSLYRTPLGAILPAAPSGQTVGPPLPADGDRCRPPPSGDRAACPAIGWMRRRPGARWFHQVTT